MRLDVYAHCTLDTVSIGDSVYERVAGGSACYCGHTGKKLRFDVGLYTRFGPDFSSSEHLAGLDIRCGDVPADTPTTRFRIRVRGGTDRDLHLENRCDPVGYGGSESDGVLVSPVFGEVSPETFSRIKKDSKFVFLDPQGFLRRTDPGNRVYLENTDVDLSGVDAVKVNPEEMEHMVGGSGLAGMKALRGRGAARVLKTDGADVSMLDGDRLYSLSLPNKEVYDTTGVGDIFSAAFACTMLRERDSLWALCFAGGAAQAALETGRVGLEKVPERGAVSTNASYFYNTVGFSQV